MAQNPFQHFRAFQMRVHRRREVPEIPFRKWSRRLEDHHIVVFQYLIREYGV